MHRRAFLGVAGGALTALHADAEERIGRAVARLGAQSPAEAAQDEDFWFRVRDAFTIDRNHINFNSGSVSPAPASVQRAMKQDWDITNMGPSLYVDELLGPRVEVARRRLAETFGCGTDELAFTRNASEAMEIVQFGLPLQAGDEVLTTTQDYPRMLMTFRQRERRDGIVLRTVPYPTPPEDLSELTAILERGITPRTKLLLICHTTFTTGQIFPVGEICRMARRHGIETLVDGAHGFAHFPFTRDELDCDYYGTSLHKWLFAPVGTGFLYVRKDKIPKVWPLMSAPASQADDIRKFEQIGTNPIAVRGPITEAVTFHEGIGAERKAERLVYLRRRWAERVKELRGVRVLNPPDIKQACGIGAMRIEGVDSGELTDFLERKYRIHVRPRFVQGEFDCIRISPSVFSTLEEVDLFASAIEDAARNGVSA